MSFGYTYRMTDAQTIYEIRKMCGRPGCPVCSIVQRSVARYIEGVYNECILDPDVRLKLVQSRGFCYEHTWLSIDIKLSDALGHAILHQNLVTEALRTLDENERGNGQQLAGLLDPVTGCPACQIEEETLVRVIDSLAAALRDQDFLDEYQTSAGLCLPHLQRLLPKLDQKRLTVLLAHQRSKMESLHGELAEFIRKNDYRFRDEAIGAEGDSYKRAADLVHGKRRAAERKDLN
jgi:hypothetical protein